jgi:hypothetical protein
MKKKWGKLKLKLNSQPTQYWKNKFDKDNLKKTCGGNTAAKQKPCKGNTVAIHIVFFFFEKSYKAKFSTSSTYKKNWQRLFSKKKKKSILGKINEKKTCKKKETKANKKNSWGKL